MTRNTIIFMSFTVLAFSLVNCSSKTQNTYDLAITDTFSLNDTTSKDLVTPDQAIPIADSFLKPKDLKKDKPIPQDLKQPDLTPKERPLYLGVMVHVEHNIWQSNYDLALAAVQNTASVFEKHKAKLTFEIASNAITALSSQNPTLLQDLQKKGHGMGLHADVGGNQDPAGKDWTAASMTSELNKQRTELDKLKVKYIHVSGICSYADWVKAAIDAGFLFTTGNVGYCGLSLADKTGLPTEITTCTNPTMCHDPFPSELEKRMHPWRMSSGANWLDDDPNGKLVILPSTTGFGCYTEYAAGKKNCTPAEDDIPLIIEEITNAAKLHKPDQFSTYYFGFFIGDIENGVIKNNPNEAILEKFFTQLDPLIKSGKVAWMNFAEMYYDYQDWLLTKSK